MVEIAESLLTEEFIVRIYEFMVISRVRELLEYNSESADGQRDGYLCCLEDLFGNTSDEEADRASNAGKTIMHVIDRITETVLPEIDEYVQQPEEVDMDQWVTAVRITRTKVRAYAAQNFDDCVDGIRTI